MVWIFNRELEIREEVKVITMAELIGSIGGSLGMFFGFSFSTFAWYFVNQIVSRAIVNF